MQNTQVIIIGAGPAGLTAALQLKRFGISFFLFESKEIGGLLHNANLVENYPGFPRGVRGEKLVNLFKKQIKNLGVEITPEKVLSLEFDGESFIAKTDKNRYCAEIAIIASGTKPRQFVEALIEQDAKSRVFYEVRDLLDMAGQEIIIVGAGDAAFDYALNLARQNRVTILNRERIVKALGLLVERVRKSVNIVYVEEVQVARISALGERRLTVEINHRENVKIMEASFILGAIGRVPNLDFLSKRIQSKEKELVAGGTLHFVGDVHNGIFRQTAIAAGEGLRTAMQIDQFFKENQ